MTQNQPRLRRHLYVPSSNLDANGVPICTCDSAKTASVHRIRELDEEQRAAEKRRIGEAE